MAQPRVAKLILCTPLATAARPSNVSRLVPRGGVNHSGAGYIVMGTFGRSRLVEASLGGVSREMLSEGPIPVAMSHQDDVSC